MFSLVQRSQAVARLAFLTALALGTAFSAADAYAQVAGFASSRPDAVGKSESGSKWSFNLNPFKSFHSEHEEPTPIVQSVNPIRSVAPAAPTANRPSPSSRSRQLAAESETRIPRTRSSASTRAGLSAPKKKASSKASSAGVAALLLDELEEDFDNDREERPAVEVEDSGVETERERLRGELESSDLELLEDEESNEELEEVDALDDEFEGSSSRNNNAKVLTTDGEEETSADDIIVVDMGLDSADEPVQVSKLDEMELVSEKKEEVSAPDSLDTLDSRFENATSGKTNKAAERAVEEVKTVRGSSSGAPVIIVETVGPNRLIVGQESVYKVVVRNEGTQTARKLVVSTDVPESVVLSAMEAQVGSTVLENKDERTNAKRCVWNVGVLDPKQERVLALKLTPMKRVGFELISNFEFERASARAGVEVQEPILEALIEGRDSIEWGVEDKFRLRLRNVGNGDAENVELFVSTGENKASQKLGTLKADEEKTIETSIKTVASEYFTIDVEASASYGVKTTASKKIGVLRGKLDVQVDAPELQFVDGEFDAKIRVRNLGDAALQHVDVVAQIPEGVEAVFCSNQARQNTEKRRVYWSAPFLRPNEETVFSVTCRVNKAGTAKFEVVGVDQTGVVAQAESLMSIESIAVLAMRVKAPKEPVAVGKRCTYELIVENNGTKDAIDVNSGVFLGSGMKPISIEGDQGVVFADESKVLFNKIDCLRAGETVVFKLEAEAMAPGNQKVQAMLQSAAEDVSLLSEETTYCYSRAKKLSPSDQGTDVLNRAAVTAEKDLDGTIRK